MAECITVAVGMFILGTVVGIFVIALVSGSSYEKGYEDGFKQCQREEAIH